MKAKTITTLLIFVLIFNFIPQTTFAASAPTIDYSTLSTISAGDGNHAMAIKSDGSLWGWGANDRGQLGDGTTDYKTVPVKVIDDAIAVSVGAYHTMAIKSDGSLWGWGANDNGQLGDGTMIAKEKPVKIMNDVIQVAAGGAFTMALKSDNSLWVWGNTSAEVDFSRGNPNPAKIMDDVIQVSAGGIGAMAVKSDGSLWYSHYSPPRKIMNDVKQVYYKGGNTCVIKTDNSLWTMESYLFSGSNSDDWKKVMDNVTSVAAGHTHILAVKTDRTLWSWGLNMYGQLGDGAIGQEIPIDYNPKKVMDNVICVAAGYGNSFALKTDGSMWSWGQNFVGNLGNGSAGEWDSGDPTPKKIMDGVRTPPLRNGDVIGNVLYSDITAYINGQPIPTSALSGRTLITVEDLANYGFDVVWNGSDRKLKVELNKIKKFKPMPVEKTAYPSGTFKCKYVYTDIKTYLSGEEVESFSINGRSLIGFEWLSKYGKVTWDSKLREIRLMID